MANWSNYRVVDYEKIPITEGTSTNPMYEISDEVKKRIEKEGGANQQFSNGSRPQHRQTSTLELSNQLIEKIKEELEKNAENINIKRTKELLKELKQYVDSELNSYRYIYADLERSVSEAEARKRAKAKAVERKNAENLIKKIKNGLDGKIASIQDKEELLKELRKYADRDSPTYGGIYAELEEKVSIAIERNAKRLIEEVQRALNESAIDIVGLKWKLTNLESYAKRRPNDYEDIYAELKEQAARKIEEEEKRRAEEDERKRAEEDRKKVEETERNIRICIAIIGKCMAEARVDIGILRRKLAELKQYTNQYPGKYSKIYDEVEKRVNNAIQIEEKRRAEEYERDRAEKTEWNIRNCIANIDKSRAEARMDIETFGDKRSESRIYIDILRRELAELKLCTNQYPDKYSKIYDETERKVNAAIAREEEKIAKEEKQAVANRVIACLLYLPLWFVMAWLSRYVIGSTWSKIVWVILLLLHGLVMYGTESDSFKDKKMMQAFFLVEIIYYVIWWVASGIMKVLIGNGWSILLSLVLLSGCIITSFTVLDEPMGFSEFGTNLLFLIRKRGYRKLLDGEYMKSINDVAKFPIVIAGIEILLAAIVKFLSIL